MVPTISLVELFGWLGLILSQVALVSQVRTGILKDGNSYVDLYDPKTGVKRPYAEVWEEDRKIEKFFYYKFLSGPGLLASSGLIGFGNHRGSTIWPLRLGSSQEFIHEAFVLASVLAPAWGLFPVRGKSLISDRFKPRAARLISAIGHPFLCGMISTFGLVIGWRSGSLSVSWILGVCFAIVVICGIAANFNVRIVSETARRLT